MRVSWLSIGAYVDIRLMPKIMQITVECVDIILLFHIKFVVTAVKIWTCILH